MKQLLRVSLAALALTASLSAPLFADEVSDCQSRIITECDQAMSGESWGVRIVLGIACAARIAGCTAVTVTVDAF